MHVLRTDSPDAAADTTHVRRHRTRALDPAGVRDVLPVIASVVPFGVILGVAVAQSASVPNWAGVLGGPLIYAGSAQLAAMSLLDAGAGLLAVVATATIINARVSIYGAALEPRFADQPRWFRALGVHTIIDQTYALAATRPHLQGAAFRRYWLTIGGLLGCGWSAAVATGAILGPVVPTGAALDFAVPACFIGLLVPHLTTTSGRTAAAVAGGVALVAAPLPNGLGLLVAVLVGLTPSVLRGGNR